MLTELVLAGFYACAEERPHAVETAEEAMAWTTVAILGLFTLEQLAKLGVFGYGYFFSFWHALDAIIVVVSLILEILLRGVAQEAVSLLVVFRFWRLIRVMHGVAETMALEHSENLDKHHALQHELQNVRPCGCNA